MSLNKEQLRYLRGLCHHINPVVMVAGKGLTENVMNELEIALDHHELVKVKVRTERDERKSLIETMVANTQAELVQSIGQTACLFRRNKKDPKIALPG
ncbi:MAG: ribosome assembly RNA-binding protein YhbY [Xanthomonadales bacterium]|jgi:RNA-binding protein|nr:ribosome assembly RNA-binding protein YhbY [Xanthomonadales bacterium]